MKASDIFTVVRALIDDPEGDYATDERLVPHLNLAINQLVAEMMANPNIGRYKQVVVVENIAAGTTSLASHLNGGELAGLDEILTMREKASADPDSQYLSMYPASDVPIITQSDFNRQYVFTGNDILLPGATQALTLRVFGLFDPAAITGPDDPVPNGCTLFLQYATAATTARSHGNRELGADYRTEAQTALATILNNIIMEQQLVPTTRGSEGEVTVG